LLLCLMAGAGGASKLPITIVAMPWRISLFSVGAIAFAFGAWLMLPAGGENDGVASSASQCALRITWPINGTSLEGHVKVLGTFQRYPQEDRVWILERSLSTGLYYFNGRPIFEKDNKQWFADYLVGGEPGSERLLQVVAVGNSGKALADYYFKVIQDTGKRVGLKTITSDVVPFDSVKLNHR
jgi:hypothetical protein